MSDQKKLEIQVLITESNETVIETLARNCTLSKQKLKDALNKGCVWLTQGKRTQRVRRAKKVLSAGSQLDMYYDPKVLSASIPNPELIKDMSDYSVWNKPSGLLSQGSKWGDHCTIARWAEQNLKPQRNSFIVHRLDRAASGLILIAHSKKAAGQLSNLFSTRTVDKYYQAVVSGKWPYDSNVTIDTPIDGKSAISHVECIHYEGTNSLLKIKIETGRKHQIRKHLASKGFPIVGDRLYNTDTSTDKDLQLTAYKIEFLCPITNQMQTFQLQKINLES
ncbi:MAG: RNA pseudouridine synthase [Gammaproteobacteria bacterium]|nr:RNA pseudouridine synthase [Gammaproteobacteria bacterium]